MSPKLSLLFVKRRICPLKKSHFCLNLTQGQGWPFQEEKEGGGDHSLLWWQASGRPQAQAVLLSQVNKTGLCTFKGTVAWDGFFDLPVLSRMLMAWRFNFFSRKFAEIGSSLCPSPSSPNKLVFSRRISFYAKFHSVQSRVSYFHLGRIQTRFRIRSPIKGDCVTRWIIFLKVLKIKSVISVYALIV